MSSEWIKNLKEKIRSHIEAGKYRITEHAAERQKLRSISLPDVLVALKNGFHEEEKSSFSNEFQAWKYAIRGKTIDGVEIRVVIAFEDNMIIISAIRLTRKKRR